MNNLKAATIFLVVFIIGLFPLYSRTGVEIDYTHVNIIKNSEYLPLHLTISNFSGMPVREVQVLYRWSGESKFQMLPLRNEGMEYYADLNLKNSDGKLMEYYFNIAYPDNRNESYPSGAPMNQIFRTAVQAARNYGDEISIISPEPDEYLYTSDVVITASFSRFAEMVNVEETKLYIGDWDVSRFLLKYNDFISFAPRTVPSGRNRVRIEFFDNNANLVASREWFFYGIGTRAVETGTEELKMTGRVFAEVRQEELVDGEYKNPYNQAGFQLAGTYNNFNFGGRVYVSNQEKSDRQPVNRFSGYGKFNFWDNRYIRVDGGDSYPKLNPMIMQNILLRGVYSRLYLKAFNVDFAYGTHLRGIEGTASVDTTTGNILNPGTFQRKILAIRPSFGSGENFQLGLTFLKGKDDTSSIFYGVNPEENVAGGMDLFLSLDKDRIIFEGNINSSFYNSNIAGGSIPFDTLKNYYDDLNDTHERLYNLADKFITVNPYLILRPTVAYQARMALRYYYNNLSFIYESVDEDYHSLGQPFLLRDNRGFHIVDNINVFKNQVFLNIGYRRYQNNLKNTKSSTTTNNNIYANLSYFPVGNLPELTIGFNSYNRENGISADSIESILYRPEDNKTSSINFSGGYRFNVLNYNNHIGLSLMNYRRTDIFKYAESKSDYLAVNLRTQYNSPLQTMLELVLQTTEAGQDTINGSKLDLTTFGLGAQYIFSNLFTTDRLFVKANLRFGTVKSDYKNVSLPDLKYNRNYYSLRINYSIPRYGTLGLSGDLLTYSGDRSYKDIIYTFRYDYNF